MTVPFLIKFGAALVASIAIVFVINIAGDMLMQRSPMEGATVEAAVEAEELAPVEEVMAPEVIEPEPVEPEPIEPGPVEAEPLIPDADPATEIADATPTDVEPVEAPADVVAAEGSGAAALLAAGDAAKGARAARKCATCHSFEPGGANKIGPNLAGIIGRDVASVEGFKYTAAMLSIEGAWSVESLDKYLESPRDQVPGTNMAFAGIRKADERLNLLKYMLETSAAE